jgi:hypothetical protein
VSQELLGEEAVAGDVSVEEEGYSPPFFSGEESDPVDGFEI